jgi:hypothetical protein
MTNRQLYAQVKAGFVLQESSLNRWCKEHKIHRQNARDALLGVWKGDGADALIDRLATDARINQGSLAADNHEHLA